MRRPDPGSVLRELARTLDIPGTLARFPGLSAGGLARILGDAAGPAPGELFASPPSSPAAKPAARPHPHPAGAPATVNIDGGARGNPGPAGAGALLRLPGAEPVGRGEYIGDATNNVAEYRALLLGIALAREHGVRRLKVLSDSELLVRQMTGAYKVKHPDLKRLHERARSDASHLDSVTYAHVPRAKNAEADLLVNRAIDARGAVSL